MPDTSFKRITRLTADGAIVLSFIAAFEIVIMISPFAGFFYAAFNPFLLALNQSSLTRWLTAFFLPHMMVPPNMLLIVIRILGSAFFLAGMAVFVFCAIQVYLGKMFKPGTATKGFYHFVRHPQYTGLALAALGLAIMWPRLLTLVLFGIMLFLYYILARDEERRMSARFPMSYPAYKFRTGMFLPRPIERLVVRYRGPSGTPTIANVVGTFAIFYAGVIAGGLVLRSYTVRSLPIQQSNGIDVISISSGDTTNAASLVPAVLADSAISSKLKAFVSNPNHRVLAYFIPVDYVMQGMIANTGDEWKLFEHHKTVGMITEYLLHPFAHLTGGHAHDMTEGMNHGPDMYAMPTMKRRVIFVDISSDSNDLISPLDDFDINAKRTPLFFVDVHLHTAEILQVRDTPAGSGWGTVPTPMF